MLGTPGGLKSLMNKQRVLVDTKEKNCFKIVNPFGFFVCEDGKQLLILFYAENAPKMWRMGMLENYADPHHRILSDALKE